MGKKSVGILIGVGMVRIAAVTAQQWLLFWEEPVTISGMISGR